ncbi:hypothetical protein BCR34DRAFT_355975 [Clohesyomyces aquaticus]|uniref:Uncharacterized protein n=1 Tax=Clohesyomyces aquaticus TaxID=1231657 RepID=A0A1Y1ZIN7_9PLEO|nr:hypothetical protein BCR34DRAFT_355975 [Clohesyomyces aquaticus]
MSSISSKSFSAKEAVEDAKAAFAKLPHGSPLFQQCISDQITIDTVLETLKEKASMYRRRKCTNILERFYRYTSWMTNISRSIDVAVNASAGIACPVWAPIKFVLMISQENTSATENILCVIQSIADNLPRIDLYSQFHEEVHFQVALVNLFTVITEFAVRATRFFGRRTPVRLGFLVLRNFKDEFGVLLATIERRTRVIDDTAIALHQRHTEEYMRVTQDRNQQENRMRAMKWLKPCNIQELHDKNLAMIANSTCEWILSHGPFRDWNEGHQSTEPTSMLVIHGPAGCGKSLLASFIFNMFADVPKVSVRTDPPAAQRTTLFFAFSAGETHRGTLASLARTLLSQMLQNDQQNFITPLLDELMQKSSVSTSDLFATLKAAIEVQSQSFTIIVDGIDECSESRDELFKQISRVSHGKSRLKIILLGQTHAFTRLFAVLPDVVAIPITPEINQADIQTVINHEIYQSRSFWGDEHVSDQISRSLSATADGMFLWVRLMLDYLRTASCESELYTFLQDLPHGLDQTYILLLNRLSAQLHGHQQRLISRLFALLISCGRPLTPEELGLAYALSIAPEETSSTQDILSYTLKFSAEHIVELCGGFVVFSGGKFDMVHNSAREFLTKESTEHLTLCSTTSRNISPVNLRRSHELFGNVCLRLFRHIEEVESEAGGMLAKSTPLVEYAHLYTIYHLNNSGRRTQDLEASVSSLLHSRYLGEVFRQDFEVGNGPAPETIFDALILFDIMMVEDPETSGNQGLEAIVSSLEDLEAQVEHDSTMTTSQALLKSIPSTASDDNLPQPEIADSEPKSFDGHTTEVPFALPSPIAQPVHETADIPIRHSAFGPSEPRGSPAHARASRILARGASKRVVDSNFQKNWLQQYHMIHSGRQFSLALGFIRRLCVRNTIKDPLRVLLDMIKQSSKVTSPLVLTAITWYYYRMGRVEEALEIGQTCCERLADQDTALHVCHALLFGMISAESGERHAGIEHLRYGLRNISRYPTLKPLYSEDYLRFCLGECHYWVGEDDKAQEILSVLLQNNRTTTLWNGYDARAYFYLAESERCTGQLESASRHFLQFKEKCDKLYPPPERLEMEEWLVPDYARMLFYLGKYYFDIHQDNNALEIFRAYIEFQNSRPSVFDRKQRTEGYMSLLLWHSQNDSQDSLVLRIEAQCRLHGPESCFKELENRYRASKAALQGSSLSLRVLDQFVEYHKAYELAHADPREHSFMDFALGFHWQFHLYDRAEKDAEALEATWSCLHAMIEAAVEDLPLDSWSLSVAASLQNMSVSANGSGLHPLATYSARVASNFILHANTTDPDYEDIAKSIFGQTIEAFHGLGQAEVGSQFTDFDSSVERQRLDILQSRYLLGPAALRDGYKKTESLLLPESWQDAQRKYLLTRPRELDISPLM